jgi:hypothetical protein
VADTVSTHWWPGLFLARRSGVRFAHDIPIGVTLLGIGIRVFLAPYTSWNYDVAPWYRTSLSGYYGLHLYDKPGFSYPPLWGYCLQLVGSTIHFLGGTPTFFGVQNANFSSAQLITGEFTTTVTSPAFNLLFKSVLFGFDLASALLIFRFVAWLTGDRSRATLAFTLWFLNPFVIWESAVQGQFDAMVGFLVLATVALLLDGRFFWAGVAWALGIMTKVTPIILVLQIIVILALLDAHGMPTWGARARRSVTFGLGAAVCLGVVAAPIVISGSLPLSLHNVFARTSSPVIVGGFSFTAVRFLKPTSSFLLWAYFNSAALIQVTTIAQTVATIGWAAFTFLTIHRNPVLSVLTGTIGTVTTFTLLSPISNPQYILWWMPVMVVTVVLTRRGYLELAVLAVAPIIFVLAILGPTAVLTPLATYSRLIPATTVAGDVVSWYQAPGRLWGAYLSDDFFAPTALISVASWISALAGWVHLQRTSRTSVLSLPTPG